jgi:hypothetical protein
MPMTVREGAAHNAYIDWAGWRASRIRSTHDRARVAGRAVPCPNCWGQRRIYVSAGNGEGYVPLTCERCLGTGLGWSLEE